MNKSNPPEESHGSDETEARFQTHLKVMKALERISAVAIVFFGTYFAVRVGMWALGF